MKELSWEPSAAGLLCQLLASLCLPLSGLAVKLAGQSGVPVLEIVFCRSVVLLILSAAMLASHSKGGAIPWPWQSERRWLLLLRGVLGMGGILGLYYTVQLLPLSEALVLGFLSPIMVTAAAPLVLGEPASRGLLLALPVCAAGVVLVAQPSFLGFHGGGKGGRGGGEGLSTLGVAVGVIQASCIAASKLTVRLLNSTEPVPAIVFALSAVSCLGSGLLCLLLPHQLVLPRRPEVWALLLAAGLMACCVQLLATTALKYSRATSVVLVSYTSLVWGLIADLAIFRHLPSPLSLLGAALVCASSLLVAAFERRGHGSSGSLSRSADGQPGGHIKPKDRSLVEVAVAAHHWGSDLNSSAKSHASPDVVELLGAGIKQPPGAKPWDSPGEQRQRPAATAAAAAEDVERAPLLRGPGHHA